MGRNRPTRFVRTQWAFASGGSLGSEGHTLRPTPDRRRFEE